MLTLECYLKTVVGTSAWVIQRSPEVWGNDADKFRPERWLEKDGETDRRESIPLCSVILFLISLC